VTEPVEALLFDLGNVITEIDFGRVVRRWSEHAGRDLTPLWKAYTPDDVYHRHERGMASDAEFFGSLRGAFGVPLTDEQFLDGWNAIFVGRYPGIDDQLRRAAARMPIYAFTNTNKAHEQYWSVAYADTMSLFRHVFVSSTIGHRKPDTDAFAYVVREMGVPAERVLFFDDSLANIEGARASGLQTVHVRSNADVAAALERLGI
jgi:putative hydrolase of the HAD superfamily